MTQDSAVGWALAIHGGAGSMTRDRLKADDEARLRDGLGRALAAGEAVLRDGGGSLDAVEAAVRVLEDDPAFNAGRGSVFSAEGRNELDAAIMDGTARTAGAVAGVARTRNPVGLARRVMEHSPHVLLAGRGADDFAREAGLEQVEEGWFRTEERWRQLIEFDRTGGFDADLKYGTVGAVARDRGGRLAAATSTGGLTGKRWGRVGDSPVIGAGTYADDRACAVSATGSGEHFLRLAAAHEIAAQVRLAGMAPEAAAKGLIAELGAMGGRGGVIVMGRDGAGGFAFNTEGMSRARVEEGGSAQVAIFGDEGGTER